MEVLSFELGAAATNAFLLINEELGQAVLIDAPEGVSKVVDPILQQRGIKLNALLLTHGHWDHIFEAAYYKAQGVPLYIHHEDLWWLEEPMMMSFAMPPGMVIEGCDADHVFENLPETLPILGVEIQVRHVPGHAPGNVAFYIASQDMIFVGDVIFKGSIGRYDLPGAEFKVLEKSIQDQIYTLPEETIIYSGHGPETTVGFEIENNPFVRPNKTHPTPTSTSMEIYLATTNKHKVDELCKMLEDSGLPISVLSAEAVGGMPFVVESEETYEGNARLKVEALESLVPDGAWVLGDDSGLSVEALGGAPGVMSARYARNGATDEENWGKLLFEMEGVPSKSRGGAFHCCLVLRKKGGEELVFQSTIKGAIQKQPKGSNGFGYDPVFVINGEDRTCAEMLPEEKDQKSHRGRALRQLLEWLSGKR